MDRYEKLFGILLSLAALCSCPAALACDDADARSLVLSSEMTAMLRMGKCNFPAFAPDDKTIGFVSDMSGSPQIWTVPVSGGWPTQVTASSDAIIGEQWSIRDWFAFLSGDGDRQICTVRADGSGYRQSGITGSLVDWTADGQRLIISGQVEGQKGSCFLLDPATGSVEAIGDEKDELVFDVSKDSRLALAARFASNYESNLYLWDFKTRAEKLLTAHDGHAHCGGGWCNRSRARFSPDGDKIYFVTNIGREKTGFAVIKIAQSGEVGNLEYLCSRDGSILNGFAINDDASFAALAWDDGKVSLLNLRSGESKVLPALPDGSVNEIVISHKGANVSVSLASSLAPEDIYVLDQGSEKWRQLTHAQHPGINLSTLIRGEKYTFRSDDGSAVSGKLFRARGQKGPGPCVLYLGGFSNSSAECALLAEEGISVFLPPKVINAHDKGHEASERLKMVKQCVDGLIKNGIADPKRVGITGHSQYGYLTLAAVTEFPSLFAACVERAGWVNFTTSLKNTSPAWAKFLNQEFGDPQRDPQLLDVLSPINRLDKVTAAIMVQHGAQDTNVPPEEAQQVIDFFKKRNVTVEALIIPDEGHNFMKLSNEVKASTALVQFFIKHLRDT